MLKRIIVLIIAIVFLMSAVTYSLAHDDQAEHDADLKYVLFGDRNKALIGDDKKAFDALADAAAITIDQFSPNGTVQWKKGVFDELQEELSALGLPKLTVSFDSLDLNISVSDDGKNITPNSHRKYTHLGWNYKKYPNMVFWNTRKQVLLRVVNEVLFNSDTPLSRLPWVSDMLYGPNEQCDAFCAMVYYIHILGDHIEGDYPEKLTDIEPLIQYRNLSIPGIIPELQEYLQIVFASQKTSWTYMSLEQKLNDLCIRAEKNCETWGQVDTKEKCAINQKYAKELLEKLSEDIPILLSKEKFFTDRFKM